MIIEMRTYKNTPGMRSRFLEIFHSKSIPAHREIGMKILGSLSFHRRHRHLFFMRGFADLASREAMKAKFHARALWKEELEHVLLPCWQSMKLWCWKTASISLIGSGLPILVYKQGRTGQVCCHPAALYQSS